MNTDNEIKTAVIKNLRKNFSLDMQKLREKLQVVAKPK